MRSGKRLLSGLVCLMMVLLLACSSLYMLCAADHCCVGSECQVCESLARVSAVLSGTVLFVCALLICFFAPCRFVAFKGRTRGDAFLPFSLVRWKIQLNN